MILGSYSSLCGPNFNVVRRTNHASCHPDPQAAVFRSLRPRDLLSASAFTFIRFALLATLPLCLLAAPPARGAKQASADPFESRLAEGIKLLGEGHLLESVKVFNEAKQSAPQDARPYFYCGMALAQAGRMRDAASEVGEAVHLAPQQLPYRVFQAHALEQLKQTNATQELLSTFQDERTLARLDPAWLRLLADIYYRLQMTDDVLKILDLWAKHDPTDARIDLYRGQVYVVKTQPDVALGCFRRSLERSSKNPQAYFEIGKILYERNQLPLAKDALLSAVREDANNPEYLAKLASVYVAMGDADAAIECLKSVEASGRMAPATYYVLARAYRIKGDAARSTAYMDNFQGATSAERDREAHKLEAERPIAQAQRELDHGNPYAARILFEKALEVDPNQWEPHAYIAEMDVDSGDLLGAYPHLQKLEQIDPDSATGNFLMARYWFKKMDYDQARLYAEKVKLSRPANSEVRALLGGIYEKLGEKEKARQEYEEAVRLAPERADLRQRLLQLGGKRQSQ